MQRAEEMKGENLKVELVSDENDECVLSVAV